MNRFCYKQSALMSMCLLFAVTTSAWNDAGHMLIAAAAFEQLSETQKQRYVDILQRHPRFEEDFAALRPEYLKFTDERTWLFAMAAAWPDRARHFGHVKDRQAREALVDKYHHGRWHYINHPIYLEPEDKRRISKPDPSYRRGLFGGVQNIVQALRYTENRLNSAFGAASTKAIYLCWWLHLMGDLHQPLHSVALFSTALFPNGDRGGNNVFVGQRRNLHQAWDGAIATSLENPNVMIRSLVNAQAGVSAPSRYADWALESAEVAAVYGYGDEVIMQLSKFARRPDKVQIRLTELYRTKQAQSALQRAQYSVQRIVATLGSW